MIVTEQLWLDYIDRLSKINATATDKMRVYIERNPDATMDEWIDYAYGLSTAYGEAAAAWAAEMYDAIAIASGANVEPAEPADTAEYNDVRDAFWAIRKSSLNAMLLCTAVGRMVKRAGADTVMRNAIRDKAYYAFIPHADTCAFCISIAAEGWKRAYSNAMKNGHAAHIHGNCDCMYAVKFDPSTEYQGYNPDRYSEMLDGEPGRTSRDKINALRRQFYDENRTEILAQKADAYEKRKELNASAAEELNA